MSIGCRTIASQRDDTGQGTRLCLDIAVDTAAFHTLLQGSIHTCYRQGMNQMLLDVIVAESITEHHHLQLGTEIVVERQARTICQSVAGSIQSQLMDQLPFHVAGTLGTCRTVARRSRNLVIHALGIEIVTLLHHLMQYLVHGMETGTDGKGIGRTGLGRGIHLLIFDACILQLSQETVHEDVLAGEHQWRKYRIIIIPAPAFAQQCSILHRTVGIYITSNGIHTHILETVDKCRQVITVETGIHTSHTVNITRQHTVLDGSGIFQLSLELIGTAQLVKCGDGSQELHRTCRAHQLSFVVLVDAGISIHIPDHDPHLRRLKHLTFQEFADTYLHRFGPRQLQCISSQGIQHRGVGHFRVVLRLHHFSFNHILSLHRHRHERSHDEAHHHIYNLFHCLLLISFSKASSLSGCTVTIL